MYNDFSRGHNDATVLQLEAEEVDSKPLGLMVVYWDYMWIYVQTKQK
jgi:hypothetical protein